MRSPIPHRDAAGGAKPSDYLRLRSVDQCDASAEPAAAWVPAIRTALELLLHAYRTAACLQRDLWDFALEIDALKEAGVNQNDLRSLVCQGLTEHRMERNQRGAPHRSFGPPRSWRFHADSCFALSPKGVLVAQVAESCGPDFQSGRTKPLPATAPTPLWDADRRELRLGSVVVKRFRQPARNQETILAAFEEDGWPPRVDNPLPANGDTDAVDRLHEAVKKLNRGTRGLLRFYSDGAGLGVLWEPASDPGAT